MWMLPVGWIPENTRFFSVISSSHKSRRSSAGGDTGTRCSGRSAAAPPLPGPMDSHDPEILTRRGRVGQGAAVRIEERPDDLGDVDGGNQARGDVVGGAAQDGNRRLHPVA